MAENLIDFWNRCPLQGPRFFHPDDQLYLEERTKYIDNEAVNFQNFIDGYRFGNFTDNKLHLSLLPSPFIDGISQAYIVVLLLNPGFHYPDYWAETHSEEYRNRLKSNLRQNFDGVSFPFFCLDPAFCWSPRFGWWEKKLRDVITRVASEKFNHRYLHALRDVAQRIAAIELVPYHAQSFDAYPLLNGLPSAKAARRYVQELAETGGKTIIVTRQIRAWRIPAGLPNVVTYDKYESRGASLSTKSKGGKAILARYKIAV